MMRWIRWSYILPRLSLLIALVILVELGAGWVVRWATETGGAQLVGARVEVGETQASLLQACVALHDIRVANPRDPMSNLVEADLLELDFESSPLLRRKVIARHGVLRGLRFGTSRATSGALAETPLPPEKTSDSEMSGQASALARKLLDDLDQRFQDDFVDQLESVRLTEELVTRWPQRYASLQEGIRDLQARAKSLEQTVQQARANPLRHAELLQQLPRDVAAFRQSFTELQTEIDVLPADFETDRRAIIAARTHDQQLIRQQLHVDTIDSAAMTAYFLNDWVAAPVNEVISWLSWSRELLPAAGEIGEAPRSRGIDVTFPGCLQSPDFLVRALQLDGTAQLAGRPVELSGVLADLNSQPAIHGQPTTLRVTTTGWLPMDLVATLDRTTNVPRDQIRAECRQMVWPSMNLGQTEQFGLAVAPSQAVLTIDLLLDGAELAGDLHLEQQSVQITPALGPQLSRWHLDETLGETLRQLDSLSTRVRLAGSLDSPDWSVESNLGPAVSTAMREALAQIVESQANDLIARSQQRVDEQLTRLDRLIAEQQQALLPELNSVQDLVRQTVGGIAGQGGLSLEKLGRKVSADSLFR